MNADSASELDKAAVRRAAARAAPRYRSAAAIELQLAQRLVERMDEVPHAPLRVLDLGSGPGVLLEALRARYGSAQITLLDASPQMLQHVRSLGWLRRRPLRVCGDLEALPLANDAFDLLVSALVLPWVDLQTSMQEMARVLQPDGLLLFTSYGPDTLLELRHAWATLDHKPHVHRFLDMHEVGDALLRAGFRDPVMDVERLTITYPSAADLFADLRASGSTNALLTRRRGLMGKNLWRAHLEALEACRYQDKLSISCEVIFGHAWGPPAGQPRRTPSGDLAAISLDELRKTLPSRD